MFLVVGTVKLSKLVFWGCVDISDLHLFQEIVLLNPCYKFFKNLILWFIDKLTQEYKV